jgi:hypothetical protein
MGVPNADRIDEPENQSLTIRDSLPAVGFR